MPAGNNIYEGIACPCNNCDTTFSGTASQIAHNFKTHYHGKHKKQNHPCEIDEAKKNNIIIVIGEPYYDAVVSSEPELSVEDVTLINDKKAPKDENIGYDLIKYISNNPVCREERQYAHYFANKLKSLKCIPILYKGWAEPLLKNSSNNDPILRPGDSVKKVFYEVAIMRDYWYSNKSKFNKCLYEYVTEDDSFNDFRSEELKDDKVQDVCNSKLHANYWTPVLYIARWMMNAKPDIGIVIKNNGVHRLTFLECKYMSGEDEYKHADIKGRMKQTDLQRHILNFICNKLKATYNGSLLNAGDVGLVRFTNGKKAEEGEIAIPISSLIE